MSDIINHEQLKEVMRTWITGVAIVTGFHKGVVHGMTINSFNSISLSPPTVIIALQHHTRTQHLVSDGGVFGVSILDISQVAVAKRFAGETHIDEPRFDDVETFSLVTGAPLIKNGLAFLDCKVVQSFEVGGTTAFLGEVLATQKTKHDPEPLLYFNRGWRKLAN